MHIVHVSSELSAIAKVGGLGDVIHGLAREQKRLGHKVEVILPKYDVLLYEQLQDLKIDTLDLWSFEDSFKYHNTIWSAKYDGLDLLLIEPHHNSYYFNRGQIYGCMNDAERFLYFSRAALEFLYRSDRRPDILHVHDWPTAAMAVMVDQLYRPIGFDIGATILSIHNMEHQGKIHPRLLTRVGLRGEDYRHEELMQDPTHPSLINLLKGGITYADGIITVSPQYAEEIKTKEFGFGLEGVINKYSSKIHGVLNGIETEYWNPSNDKHLYKTYSTNATYVSKILEHKNENKEELFQRLSMTPTSRGPLIASITRLVQQKGPKLIQRAIRHTLKKGGIFILLGTAGDKHTEKEFLFLKHQYRANPNFFISLQFNERLAHLIYAAADAMIIPSIFEPCGLTQMIGMRYGTIPIGRKTGGLANTIIDKEQGDSYTKDPTGFLFERPEEHEIDSVLDRTFDCFHHNRPEWKKMIQNGLSIDLSWQRSAKTYDKIYHFTKSLRKKTSRKKPLPEKKDLVI